MNIADFDVCTCGDWRHNHEEGRGRRINSLFRGRQCNRFEFDHPHNAIDAERVAALLGKTWEG